MILHYLAFALIVLEGMHHVLSKGHCRSIRRNTLAREAGASALSNSGFAAVVTIVYAFFLATAVLIVLPWTPVWIEILIGACWLVLGAADGIRGRGKTSGAYFGFAIGTLILFGSLT